MQATISKVVHATNSSQHEQTEWNARQNLFIAEVMEANIRTAEMVHYMAGLTSCMNCKLPMSVVNTVALQKELILLNRDLAEN